MPTGIANSLVGRVARGRPLRCRPRGGRRDRSIYLSANPPYVAEGDWAGLPEDVRREPRLALVAGPTGMEVAERVLAGVRRWLAPTGEAWVEVGEDQAQTLAQTVLG